jgi:hypothetical protein
MGAGSAEMRQPPVPWRLFPKPKPRRDWRYPGFGYDTDGARWPSLHDGFTL